MMDETGRSRACSASAMRWRPVTFERATDNFSPELRRNLGEVLALMPAPRNEVVIESVAHGGSGYNVVIRMVVRSTKFLLQRAGGAPDGEAADGRGEPPRLDATPLPPMKRSRSRPTPKRRRTRRRRPDRASPQRVPWPRVQAQQATRGVARRHRRGPGSRSRSRARRRPLVEAVTVAVRGVWLRRPSSPKTPIRSELAKDHRLAGRRGPPG